MNSPTATPWDELRDAVDLPTLPAVVQEALRLLGDDRVSLREVGRLISTDPVLGARVLQLVNSSWTGLRQTVRSIQDGVVFLGTRHMRNLLLSCSVVDALSDPERDLGAYWEHGFGCGYVASRLSGLLRVGHGDDAYLGGLFHDLGRILLVLRWGGRYGECLERARAGSGGLLEAERQTFGADHAEVGAWLAGRWRFPDGVEQVVRHHHRPQEAHGHEVEAALVQLADYLCWSRGLIDVAQELAPTELVDEPCWQVLASRAPAGAPLDPHLLLHEADTMVHTARQLVHAVYRRPASSQRSGA